VAGSALPATGRDRAEWRNDRTIVATRNDMTSRVFISHAGGDAPIAGRIADLLGAAGIEPVLDRRGCGPGDSFLSFMEGALGTSD